MVLVLLVNSNRTTAAAAGEALADNITVYKSPLKQEREAGIGAGIVANRQLRWMRLIL